jgi:hypothetical protein
VVATSFPLFDRKVVCGKNYAEGRHLSIWTNTNV